MTTLLMLLAMVALAGAVWADVRPPAVAGAFYPSTAEVLRAQVDEALSGAAPGPVAIAVVVPHAGYVFSGDTAAAAFARLQGQDVDRVVLLGPSHHAHFKGAALPAASVSAFRTPLGEIALDRQVLSSLGRTAGFDGPASAHGPEHSLEVELPFLQVVTPRAKLVPILIGANTGRSEAREVAEGLAPLLQAGTVVVVSTDFSHHGRAFGWAPFDGSRDVDDSLLDLARETAGRVAAVDGDGFWSQVEVSGDTVCGARPVAVLLELLERAFEGGGTVEAVTNSGRVSGDWSRVVSYAAVSFAGRWTMWRPRRAAGSLPHLTAEQGRGLVELARAALATHLRHDASLARWFATHPPGERVLAPAGAFVTLHATGERARREGRLRACMGVIEARMPAVEAIMHAARTAARDPRFPPLEARELDEVQLEISVLSAPRPVPGPEAIEVGTHGVVLERGGRGAVFLPQVATEQGWDRDTMLSHLARKAGLPADGWRSGARFEVFTAQVFAEEE